MTKRLIMATSTSCLDYYPEPHDVRMIRIKMTLHDKTYSDGLDLRAGEFYKTLRADDDLVPRTSQPSVGEMIELFEGVYNEGYEEIFVVTISKQLSGSFNSLYLASLEFEGKMKITVFDTQTVFFNEGYCALAADRLFKEGKTTEEVIAYLEKLKTRNTLFFAVGDLKYLIRNGRLTGAKAFFGKLLNIKPVLEVKTTLGQIVSIHKERTVKKAFAEVARRAKEYIGDKKATLCIVYADYTSLVDTLKEIVYAELGVTNIMELPASPVVGSHIGPDGMGISIILEE